MALALLAALPVSVAVAEPRPTIAQAKAKLTRLNEQADQVVEKYNQATEAYKKAKAKYQTLDGAVARKRAEADALKQDLVVVAVNSYQLGGLGDWQVLLGQDLGSSLDRMASIDHMALAQQETLHAFETATADLRHRRDDAKAVFADALRARDKVRDQKTKVERLVTQQTALLRRLGAFQEGDPDSTGIKYTGPASGDARAALQFAFAQVGKPYRYGGTGPNSFDCSGFTQASWKAAGVQLPRTTYAQWAWGAGRRVSLDALEPGDLLFSKGLGHMGMYAGDGKMIHSPQTGEVVKIVDIDDYWRGRLAGAVRP
ncbi:C40 family peptidase [Streptosporangiaceae bacterium NEAU-GS5]|nr:C40 family peptidase [Streptosporangiaceae bacterium NEAU-GS5]